ncbi:MAG: glycerol-3-phosphate 1-O-acyltransferase PlsY [Candidatus Aminicenantia bacterium]
MKILLLIFSYLLGSVPFGYILFWFSEKKDIRQFGSGNIGFTNVARLKGISFGLPVLVLDILKGFIPVFFAIIIFDDLTLASLAGFLAVAGHIFSVFLKFRGGKGFATTLGVFACLSLKGTFLIVGIALICVFVTRYVSLGSILGAFFYPIILLIFDTSLNIVIISTLISILVIIRHQENIRRLLKGEERKIGKKYD